ncbi:Post-segregation antitoxin CcdA [Magnetococcus marinus MC-1]|uniref:Post-segregation antitoxin CcdA n=2 Tax=Magnetococcus TaxID=162171 RepID=A0L724_MAGMM|nr:Post-segregation antitoxin CcdA [Magnetococcus marinus MC-1]
MHTSQTESAKKDRVNLSMNSELVQKAKALNINLSKELEKHLDKLVAERQQQVWKEENQEAIKQYNSRVLTDGLFGDKLRQF